MLNDRLIKLSECLNQLIQSSHQAKHQFQFDSNVINKHLTCLNEDIHWILLISGFILFEINNDLEHSKIPKEIMIYSISFTKYLNIDFVQKLFNMLNPAMMISPIGSPSSTQAWVIEHFWDLYCISFIRKYGLNWNQKDSTY